ncbi:MAG: hypothetical protein WB676_27050 [Bryobacteraceae bacterium]
MKDLTDLKGLVWAAGGHGWFVSAITTVGNRLLYVYMDGRIRSLGDIQGWAVPSPDGQPRSPKSLMMEGRKKAGLTFILRRATNCPWPLRCTVRNRN